MFVFQAKLIGHYIMNEVRYGGATYVATGRGLPVDRRPFVGEPVIARIALKIILSGLDVVHISANDALKSALETNIVHAISEACGDDVSDDDVSVDIKDA